MKLMIDISKDCYDAIMARDWKNAGWLFSEELNAIHDGKIVEQEPCDAVSRESVIDRINLFYHSTSEEGKKALEADSLIDDINNLPSVHPECTEDYCPAAFAPKQRTGRWIRVTDEAGHFLGWECNKCSLQQRFNTEFCPDCGAKMQEVDK